ncbi:unnamed protein product [Cylindrotheca closterium]|uniref:Uncharacterized protein n=1 Tax=Cylindrotheca closterium TaxID=2856 RepID=A0AAD2FRE1_9STRA|nr:unnamed protein product [Cylindrotheca closterium]
MEDTTAKSNISNEDDDQSMQPPSAMLSLLDKYSRMEAQMTHVRQETTRIQLEIQARNSSAEKLAEERQGMIVEQERFSKETKILQEDAKIARQKLNSTQQEALQAKERKEEARRNLDRLEMQSKEYRRRFFYSSQSFRNECKKRKVTCQALGLTRAPLVAHAMEASKQRREQLKKQKDDLLSRSRDRRQRKTSLEAQLGRILKDIDMLNSRIQGEKRPTTISTQATTNSNSTFVLPAARGASKILLNNPYAKCNRKQSPPSSLSSTKAMNPRRKSSPKGSDATIEQYPHIVGRQRAPRGFGLSLRIEDGIDDSDDDDDDDLLSFVGFRK